MGREREFLHEEGSEPLVVSSDSLLTIALTVRTTRQQRCQPCWGELRRVMRSVSVYMAEVKLRWG